MDNTENTTTLRLSVTRAANKEQAHRVCRGLNHHDHGYRAYCDRCNANVIQWVDNDEKTKKITDARERSYCFDAPHQCDPESVALYADAMANKIRKGSTVEVIKGRKVPIGTTGVVFWVAPEADGYGVYKIGFTTDTGDKHFLNIENVTLKAAQ